MGLPLVLCTQWTPLLLRRARLEWAGRAAVFDAFFRVHVPAIACSY